VSVLNRKRPPNHPPRQIAAATKLVELNDGARPVTNAAGTTGGSQLSDDVFNEDKSDDEQ
jgi:hypothetical protein